jgi:hypothetical protein
MNQKEGLLQAGEEFEIALKYQFGHAFKASHMQVLHGGCEACGLSGDALVHKPLGAVYAAGAASRQIEVESLATALGEARAKLGEEPPAL